jgi:hypothetical protein
MNSTKPSPDTLNLLLKYEVGGGESYYNKFLSKFTWPGGASGPTIGIGIDCAYYTENELKNIFSFLPQNQLNKILLCPGKTGSSGKEYTRELRSSGIEVVWEEALKIFEKVTWPKFTKLAEKTFPGLENLHPNAYGAIISLVFNRGTKLTGDSRIEMRNIKTLIPLKKYKEIASEIKKMKRLWRGKNLDGLLERRDAEAKMVEDCV